MGVLSRRDSEPDRPREDTPNTQEGAAIGTPPGESVMDKLQEQQQQTGGEEMNVPVSTGDASNADQSQPVQNQVEVDRSAVDLDAPEFNQAPKQVEKNTVIYVPRKDFEARVNDSSYRFAKGVPHEVTRDVANMLLEDEDRGYVRD